MDITPPDNLYVPVLPPNIDNKLMFHLNEMRQATWSSVELQRALEVGYVITKIHSALEYEKQNGLMKDYVGLFMQMKNRK